MPIPCIEKVKNPALKERINGVAKEGIPSLAQRTAIMQEVLAYHKELFNRNEGLRKDAGLKAEKYVAPEIKTTPTPNTNAAFFSRDGSVLGLVSGGKVFFNPDAVRMDTPMHEIGGHMLTAWAKQNQPELYQKILSVAASAPEEARQFVRDNYKEYQEGTPQFEEEVFSTALGLDARNLQRANELAEKNPQGFAKLRTAINDIWQQFLNFLTDKGIIKGETFDPNQFRDMTFADFSNLVGEKISSGRRLSAPGNVAINSPNALLNHSDYTTDAYGNPIKVRADVQKEIEAEKEGIKQDAIAKGTYLLSPKGTASLLTADQWATVRTKRYVRWAFAENYNKIGQNFDDIISKLGIEKEC